MAVSRLNNTLTAVDFPAQATGGAATPIPGGAFDVIVTNAAVYMSVGVGRAEAIGWEDDRGSFLPPGGYSFAIGDGEVIERADAVRFRSAGDTAARVTVIA